MLERSNFAEKIEFNAHGTPPSTQTNSNSNKSDTTFHLVNTNFPVGLERTKCNFKLNVNSVWLSKAHLIRYC